MTPQQPPPKTDAALATLPDIFARAVEAHQQGKLAAAEQGYRAVLAAYSDELETHYLLGALLVQSERDEEAVPYLERYVKHKPDNAPALDALGAALSKVGRDDEAVRTLKRAVQITPNDPQTLANLGRAALAADRPEEGVKAFETALKLQPAFAEAAIGYASCLDKLEDRQNAIAVLRQFISGGAATSSVHEKLLTYLIEGKKFEEAHKRAREALATWPDSDAFVLADATALRHIHPASRARPVYEELLRRAPNNPSYLNKYGDYLYDMGEWDEAEQFVLRSFEINPNVVDTVNNLGRIRQQKGDLEGSIKFYLDAIDIKPEYADAHNNLGNVFLYTDQIDKAIESFDRAISLKPHKKDYYFNRSIALMTSGEIRPHLEDHWTRFEKDKPISTRTWPWPKWNGESLQGKRVFLYGEQGIGDEIIHARCAAQVVKTAEFSILECSERLMGLYQRSFPGINLRAYSNPADKDLLNLEFDVQASTLDMNCWAYETADDITPHPYLKPDPAETKTLRERYQSNGDNRPLIGISWSSGGTRQAHFKSTPLELWKPILAHTDVKFVNLQYGDWSQELKTLEEEDGLEVISDPEIDPLGDLDLYAAQVAAMDHVITISNATAHLAGALGVPVWNMVPTGPGRLWYWFMEGANCPWYGSMRLFRHAYQDGWGGVLTEVEEMLSETIPSLGSPTHLPY